MSPMDSQVVLVTGGSSGIGRASALALAKAGAAVVVADVQVDGGEETVAMIHEAGGRAHFVEADVTRAADVEAMVKGTINTFGRLDAAVNNAGISGSMMSRVHEMPDEVFDRIMGINVKGVWLSMKAELAIMLEQGSGSIVNMASVAGLIGSPKGAAYAASKHAVIGLTKSASVEYAKFGIRVNAVCPAFTDTPMVTEMVENEPIMKRITVQSIPMKRLGTPEEIAEGVVWLCSDASSFVTGHALAMDGGLVAT